MFLLHATIAVISWLGRQGTQAFGALVLIGIAFPWIDGFLKPYVTEAVFVLLCISLLRTDIAAVKAYLRRPAVVLAATGGALPDLTWLHFALSQFPIYLSPQLLQSMARRALRRTSYGCVPEQEPK